MAKKGAPYNNKNAAGPHNTPNGLNRIVKYKTGILGNIGIGKTHIGFAKAVSNPDGTSWNELYKKDLSPGLPKNTAIKSIKYFTVHPGPPPGYDIMGKKLKKSKK